MVQISAGDRAELLLQVDPLRLRHAGGHGQTLQENISEVSGWKHDHGHKLSFKTRVGQVIVLIVQGFALTCRYRGRLSLSALSCCVRLWGSISPSTMRNSSCWALDVASRGLQCFTMQPETVTVKLCESVKIETLLSSAFDPFPYLQPSRPAAAHPGSC